MNKKTKSAAGILVGVAGYSGAFNMGRVHLKEMERAGMKAATEAGCEWFVVEQDICPRDPFECVANSLNHLVSPSNWTADRE